MSSTVEDWLRSLGLIQHTQAFLDNGYDELDICKEIGEEDLDAIGVGNIRDRVDILCAVERLRQVGTAVYFVLEEGDQTPQSQSPQIRAKFIPLKLKMLLHDKLEEDKVKLTDPPYTRSDGSCGNLTALVTLYADKFYTYEEDVLAALQSMRQRMAGDMNKKQNEGKQAVKEATLPRPPSKNSPSIRVRQRESSSSSVASVSSDCHSTPPDINSKVGTPADYLDVSSPILDQKVKRRRPVERNSKLSRSLDSLKELHVNARIKEVKPREREASSFRNKFSWFRSSKRSSKAVSHDDKLHEVKPSPPGDLPASNITMGEEDRMTLMIMVKQGDLTVEEAVEQLEAYEKEQQKAERQKRSEQKSDSCSEEDSPSAKPKIKRGFFAKSMKKRHSSRPMSEIAACDMTMSEQDRIDLMKRVRDHHITVEQALQRLMSYEEKHKDDDSPSHKSKSTKHKFSPKSPRASANSRISIKRVSGAFASVMGGPSTKPESASVFYTGQDSAPLTGSEDDVIQRSDSSPDPSPSGNRRLLLDDLQNEFQSSSSLHSSSSSSVGRINEEQEPQCSASAPAHQLHGLLTEIQSVLSVRADENDVRGFKATDLPPEKVSTMPRREKPAASAVTRKGSLPNPPPKQALIPPSSRRAPPPPPPRKPTPPNPREATPPLPPPTKPKSTEDKSNESSQESGAESKSPTPLPRTKLYNTKSRALSPEEGSEDDDNLPLPPPSHLLLQEDEPASNVVKLRSVFGTQTQPPKWKPPSHVASEIPVIPPRRRSKDYVTENVTQGPPVTEPPALPPRPVAPTEEHTTKEHTPQVYYNSNLAKSPFGSVAKDTTNSVARDTANSVAKDVPDSVAKAAVRPKPPVKSKPKPPPKRPKPSPPTASKPVTGGVGEIRRSPPPLPAGKGDVKTSDALPVPVPKKRASHSLSELIERRLRIEQIDLAETPYTDATGRWCVPVNLVDRYAEELRRSKEEVAQIMDRIRQHKLKEQGRTMIPYDFQTQLTDPDPVGDLTSLTDWLVSLGLPMYVDNMKEVEYDDMSYIPYLQQKHFEYAGVVDERHMRRLLASVEKMPR